MKHDKPRYAAFDDEPKGTWTNPPPLAPEPEPRRLKMLHQSDVQTWLSARRIEAQRQLFAAASEGRDDALPGFRAQLDVIAELERSALPTVSVEGEPVRGPWVVHAESGARSFVRGVDLREREDGGKPYDVVPGDPPPESDDEPGACPVALGDVSIRGSVVVEFMEADGVASRHWFHATTRAYVSNLYELVCAIHGAQKAALKEARWRFRFSKPDVRLESEGIYQTGSLVWVDWTMHEADGSRPLGYREPLARADDEDAPEPLDDDLLRVDFDPVWTHPEKLPRAD